MRPRPRSERGDTLVEVVVSVVILGLITAGFIGGMTTTTVSSGISRNQADAETLLTSVVEAVKDPTQYPYDCSGGTYVFNNVVSNLGLPGWSATVKTIMLWNPATNKFDPSLLCTNPTQDPMQDLLIEVKSPDLQLVWTREILKGAR